MDSRVRAWGGMSLLALIGIALALYAVWKDLPKWLVIFFIVMTVVGVVLTWPGTSTRKVPSTFIRGSVSNSSLIDVRSEADTFIAGPIRETLLQHILHTPRKGR